MSDVPKIVHDRLRASVAVGAHPDADVLTAFAEQALSGAEREGVVRHLSRCADCREVVALSIPPMEAVAQPQPVRDGVPAAEATGSSGLRAWFAWPNLRWAAMAAAVVVVASVLGLRPGKQNQSMVEIANQQAEKTAPSADASARSPTPSAGQAAPPAASTPAKPDNSLARKEPALRLIAPETGRVQTQIPASAGARLADNKSADSLEDKRGYSFEADKPAMKVPAVPGASVNGGIAASEHSEQRIGSSTETVEVTAADALQPAPMDPGLTARNELTPPVKKAKPATKEEAQPKAQLQESVAQNKLAAAYSTSDTASALQKRSTRSKDVAAQWTLAQGRLQRSLDAGTTWQIALQLQHPLLSFGARGGDVWAGGQAGTLFHSTDNGMTWTMVQPSTKSESLSSDIVAIEIRSQAEIVLSIRNNESWTTVDAGKTWEKK